MVAAKHDGDDASVVDRAQAVRYPLVALLDEARDHGDVAVIYDREVLEDLNFLRGVVGAQQVRGAPYGLGAEAGPGAEGGAGVEWRADDSDVGVLQILVVRQAH